MCYKVKCSTCGKTGWGGCGNHLPSVYKSIPEGQQCLCRAWPGVNLDAQTSGAQPEVEAQPSSFCTIL